MNDDFRWFTVEEGDTLLESVAKSCCHRKGSLILSRIMAARYKESRVTELLDTNLGRYLQCPFLKNNIILFQEGKATADIIMKN